MDKAIMVVAISLAAASSAAAQTVPVERWSISFGAGTAPALQGVYHEGGAGTVLGLPTQVQSRDWSDIYSNGFNMRVGAGYAVTSRMEVTGAFLYSRRNADELQVGNVAGLDLRSQFSNYRDRGVEGGVRWHFAPEAGLNPYIGMAAGVRWVDAMPATFSVPSAGVVLTDTPFYGDSTAPTFGPDFGLQVAVAPRVRFGVEARLRWSGNLSALEGLAGTGLENLNDSSSKWSMPVLGTISMRF